MDRNNPPSISLDRNDPYDSWPDTKSGSQLQDVEAVLLKSKSKANQQELHATVIKTLETLGFEPMDDLDDDYDWRRPWLEDLCNWHVLHYPMMYKHHDLNDAATRLKVRMNLQEYFRRQQAERNKTYSQSSDTSTVGEAWSSIEDDTWLPKQTNVSNNDSGHMAENHAQQAAVDPELKDLLKSVVANQATKEQVQKLQKQVDELHASVQQIKNLAISETPQNIATQPFVSSGNRRLRVSVVNREWRKLTAWILPTQRLLPAQAQSTTVYGFKHFDAQYGWTALWERLAMNAQSSSPSFIISKNSPSNSLWELYKTGERGMVIKDPDSFKQWLVECENQEQIDVQLCVPRLRYIFRIL